jgi:hypothetical protein
MLRIFSAPEEGATIHGRGAPRPWIVLVLHSEWGRINPNAWQVRGSTN